MSPLPAWPPTPRPTLQVAGPRLDSATAARETLTGPSAASRHLHLHEDRGAPQKRQHAESVPQDRRIQAGGSSALAASSIRTVVPASDSSEQATAASELLGDSRAPVVHAGRASRTEHSTRDAPKRSFDWEHPPGYDAGAGAPTGDAFEMEQEKAHGATHHHGTSYSPSTFAYTAALTEDEDAAREEQAATPDANKGWRRFFIRPRCLLVRAAVGAGATRC